MKKILIFIFLLLCFDSFAQVKVLKPRIMLDFFGFDIAQSHQYKLDSIYDVEFESIEIGNKTLAVHKFFLNTKIVAEVYMYIGKKTYLYVRYDSISHDIIEKGKLKYLNHDFSRIDTLKGIDAESYDETIQLIKYKKWSKEGHWREIDGIGEYKKNIKIGEWQSFKRDSDKGFQMKYILYDKKGKTLSVTPDNILKTNDLEKIKTYIIGNWSIDNGSNYVENINMNRFDKEPFSSSDVNFEFQKAVLNTYPRRKICGYGRTILPTKWTITSDFVIKTADKNHILNNFKITFLSRYEFKLEKLK